MLTGGFRTNEASGNINQTESHLVGLIRERMVPHVRADDEPGEVLIADGVDGVANDAEDVETRQDRLRQVDVVGEGLAADNKSLR